MDSQSEKLLVMILILAALIGLPYFLSETFSVARSMASPATAWKGGDYGFDWLKTLPSGTLGDPSARQGYVWKTALGDMSLISAVTPAEQELGLGQRASLPTDTAMIFVFSTPGDYGFWMKDMQFPLDIVWLDQDFRIVHIENDLSPSTYPKAFSPGAPSSFVLEMNAGLAQKLSLNVGDTVEIVPK